MSENRFVLPLAIIFGGIIVAVALYLVLRAPEPELVTSTDLTGEMRPLDDTDHILGNPMAPIMFIEYSDIDSPFAKVYEQSLRGIIAEYGDTGQVAWTYRHLPVINQHPLSVSHAEAAECMGDQGGTPAFFNFIEHLHAAAPGTTEFDPKGYVTIVQKLGGDPDAFNGCLASDTFLPRVTSDAENALMAGAVGAPYTILLVKGQEPVPIEGLITGEKLREIVETSLAALPK